MKPQDAPLVTGYALACVVLFVLLSITGFQIEAFVRAEPNPDSRYERRFLKLQDIERNNLSGGEE